MRVSPRLGRSGHDLGISPGAEWGVAFPALEGAETMVMRDFHFEKYTFKIITVERPKPEPGFLLGNDFFWSASLVRSFFSLFNFLYLFTGTRWTAKELVELLERHGYRKVRRNAHWDDELWLHQPSFPEFDSIWQAFSGADRGGPYLNSSCLSEAEFPQPKWEF